MSETDTVLPAHESLIADWKQNAERNGDANFRFLRSLKMVREKRVDTVAHELHRQVFGIIDCTRCSHCCKTMPPQLNDEDIERIAAALPMARADFITAYLVPDEEEGGLKMKATPCPFLGPDDRCTIYDIRPENCRSFPNTDKEGLVWRTYQLSDNTQNCPAVYHIVEGMRHGRGFSGSHPVLDTPLQVDAIVGELDAPAQVLPREAIAAARRHREHIIPLLIDLIEQAARTAAQGYDVDYNGHFFALFLLTEFATEALPAIVAAVSLPGEAPFTLFEDAITETLPRVFAVLAHERVVDVLLPLMRNRRVNEYVRRAAADSLAYMVSAGLRQRDDMMNLLKELLREAVEHTDSELVTGLIGTLCDLYPEEAIEEIRTAYARGLVDEPMITLDNVERELRRGREEALKRFFQRRVFIDDTVKELEGWAAFRPDDDDEESAFPVKSRPKPLPTVLPTSRPAPARHPEGRVGRNDPCPCGSGKKFKKCCALKS